MVSYSQASPNKVKVKPLEKKYKRKILAIIIDFLLFIDFDFKLNNKNKKIQLKG